jgi:HTH-type transcriptional regulator/antitoxin HigA
MKSTPKRSDSGPSALKPRVIKTQAQYEATMARIEQIFEASPNTPEGEELELLLLLVETYEDIAYPIDLPDPIAALRFRMEQDGLKPKDLIPFIGSKSKVSEVLNRQRPLSLTMIRKLVAGLRMPAEVALQAHTTQPRKIRSAKTRSTPAVR